jgi:hypothetical protein
VPSTGGAPRPTAASAAAAGAPVRRGGWSFGLSARKGPALGHRDQPRVVEKPAKYSANSPTLTPDGSIRPRVGVKPAKYSANSPTLTPDGSIRPRVGVKPAKYKYSANSPTLPLAPSATPSSAPTEAQIATPTALPPDRRPAAIPVQVLRHPRIFRSSTTPWAARRSGRGCANRRRIPDRPTT